MLLLRHILLLWHILLLRHILLLLWHILLLLWHILLLLWYASPVAPSQHSFEECGLQCTWGRTMRWYCGCCYMRMGSRNTPYKELVHLHHWIEFGSCHLIILDVGLHYHNVGE